jgi:hypothetical protein
VAALSVSIKELSSITEQIVTVFCSPQEPGGLICVSAVEVASSGVSHTALIIGISLVLLEVLELTVKPVPIVVAVVAANPAPGITIIDSIENTATAFFSLIIFIMFFRF